MVKEGIVDAAKVLRVGFDNAMSVAMLLLTSDTLVANAPKKDEDEGPGGPGQHMHGGEGMDY